MQITKHVQMGLLVTVLLKTLEKFISLSIATALQSHHDCNDVNFLINPLM